MSRLWFATSVYKTVTWKRYNIQDFYTCNMSFNEVTHQKTTECHAHKIFCLVLDLGCKITFLLCLVQHIFHFVAILMSHLKVIQLFTEQNQQCINLTIWLDLLQWHSIHVLAVTGNKLHRWVEDRHNHETTIHKNCIHTLKQNEKKNVTFGPHYDDQFEEWLFGFFHLPTFCIQTTNTNSHNL